MIFEAIKKDPVDFGILGVIFLAVIVLFFNVSYDNTLKEGVVFLTGFLYLSWGIFHHWRKEDLCLKIVLEYFLMALLGIVVTVFVVLRA